MTMAMLLMMMMTIENVDDVVGALFDS